MGLSLLSREASSPMGGGAGPAPLLQCPSRGRASYLRASEEWNQLSTALGLQHTVPMTSCANTGPRHQPRSQLQQEQRPRCASWQQCSPNIIMAQVTPQPPRSLQPQWQQGPQTPTWWLSRPFTSTQPPWWQQEPWIPTQTLLLLGHGPRHGPQQQPGHRRHRDSM